MPCASCFNEASTDFLQCLACKKPFHSRCTDISERDVSILRLLDNASRAGWVCLPCRELVQQALNPLPYTDDTRAILGEINVLKNLVNDFTERAIFSTTAAAASTTGAAATGAAATTTATTAVTSGAPDRGYAGALRVGIPANSTAPPPVSPSTQFRQLLATTAEQSERERSLVISGMEPKRGVSDFRLLVDFMSDYLDLNVNASLLKVCRVGRFIPGRQQLIRATFSDPLISADVLAAAIHLRDSADADVRAIYFNKDRSKAEQELGFAERQARRVRIQQREIEERRRREGRSETSQSQTVRPQTPQSPAVRPQTPQSQAPQSQASRSATPPRSPRPASGTTALPRSASPPASRASSGHVSGRTNERTSDWAAEPAGERAGERTGERAAERAGERASNDAPAAHD